ncbi:hypothetical protein [Hydrogenophaga sp. BPS33]|uniref:hypothetical protein n=1 Tax=Hydrogenophaga sp. BPS33 TaxID=2651974 RepID=UPI0013200E47|nr:hypothetical protein [Hydrogenophaga sp. BPS33]QHE84902.1 hypothetical protein F9K07_08380 [Hydrogenophaga sp. BPS33]
MPLGLHHQVGHNAVWNMESFQREHCGDGLILSPLHQALPTVKNMDLATRAASLFDPQFYLPTSRKRKLLSYPFFPEQVEGGFQTGTFPVHAPEVARSCVDFQIEQGFRKVVVPTRFLNEMYPEYFEMQGEFSVNAFIEAAGSRPLCLSLAVKASMMTTASWRRMLLDWITSFHQVDELYLMYEHVRDTKQIQDSEFLREALRFFREVMATGLKLTIGYTNTEGLLFSTIGDPNITMGTFENTRIFSVDKFVESDSERRGPRARIYLAGLMNWVQFEDAKRIRDLAPEVWRQVYFPTDWAEQALAQPIDPTFNQPALYKHYFLNMQEHVNELRSMTPSERRHLLQERVAGALRMYRALEPRVQLERHGQAGHLAAWQQALQTF